MLSISVPVLQLLSFHIHESFSSGKVTIFSGLGSTLTLFCWVLHVSNHQRKPAPKQIELHRRRDFIHMTQNRNETGIVMATGMKWRT